MVNESLQSDWKLWSEGSDGRTLRLQRCEACLVFRHPPGPICPQCGSTDSAPVGVSGRATVLAFTVNYRAWEPSFEVPYVVAVVGIDEDPAIRLTTNIVDVDPNDLAVGLRVQVVFREQSGSTFPVFVPSGEHPIEADVPGRTIDWTVRPMITTRRFEDDVSITGIGTSRIGRRLMEHPTVLTVEACRAAMADAGLTPTDIDGLSTYPGPQNNTGMSEGGIAPIEDALRISPSWFNSGFELPGQLGAVSAAMLAVSAGLCRHVLCFRTVWQSTESTLVRRGALSQRSNYIWGSEWRSPFGASKAISLLAARANRYFHEYGADREMLGWVATTTRRHAGKNPSAIYRDPLSMDDYLAADPLSTPFTIYDCDLLCDGAVAFIVSRRDESRSLRSTPVDVEAVGSAITERMPWDQGVLTHEPQIFGPAAHMWSRTTLRPNDVDVAELYDGFSFNAISWIEALGFCGIGEAKDFVAGGHEITFGGSLPLNTHGGQLSAGRLHGFGYLHEAVVQLRGDAGERQVHDAEVACVSSGGLQPGGAMLLTRS